MSDHGKRKRGKRKRHRSNTHPLASFLGFPALRVHFLDLSRFSTFDARGNVIEERTLGDISNSPGASNSQFFASTQYVYSPAGANHLVLRDSNAGTSGGDLGVTASGMNQRLYAIQDAQGSTTAILGVSANGGNGYVVERYRYQPVGAVAVLDASGTVLGIGSGASAYSWRLLYAGSRDDGGGIYFLNGTEFNSLTGLPLKEDPMAYKAAQNVYSAQNIANMPYTVTWAQQYQGLLNSFVESNTFGLVTAPQLPDTEIPQWYINGGVAAIPIITTAADVGSFIPGVNAFAIPLAIAMHGANRYAAGDSMTSVYGGAAVEALANLVGFGIGGKVIGAFSNGIKGGWRMSCRAASTWGGIAAGGAGGIAGGALQGGFNGYVQTGWDGVWSGAGKGALWGGLQGAAMGGIFGFFDPRVCFIAGTQVVVALRIKDENGKVRMLTARQLAKLRANGGGVALMLKIVGYVTESIETLREGGWVISRDQHDPDGELTGARINRKYIRRADHVQQVGMIDDSGEEQLIHTTDEHPFYGVSRGWTKSQDLETGDFVSGMTEVQSWVVSNHRQSRPVDVAVYNIEVEGTHTYFVRAQDSNAEPVWVHNNCDGLIPGTAEHKAQRWQDYQARGGALEYRKWSTKYDVAMENSTGPLLREAEYRAAFNGENRVVETPYGNRQVDVLSGSRMLQIKTGYEYLTEMNQWAIQRDAWLVGRGKQVEWVLEQGGSGPLVTALEAAGIKVHTSPLI